MHGWVHRSPPYGPFTRWLANLYFDLYVSGDLLDWALAVWVLFLQVAARCAGKAEGHALSLAVSRKNPLSDLRKRVLFYAF
jgi:hypothetical protein